MQSVKQLRSFEAWEASLQNFKWLEGIAPGATDIDFLLHAHTSSNDNFLLLEFKNYPSPPLSLGQRLTFEALQRQGFTVVVVYGPDKDGLFVLSWDWKGKVDLEGLRTLVANWWKSNKRSKSS